MSVKRASAGNRQQALPQRQEQAGALSHTFAADALCVNHQVSRPAWSQGVLGQGCAFSHSVLCETTPARMAHSHSSTHTQPQLLTHPGEGSPGEGPGERQQVPGRDGDEVQAGREGHDADEHRAPGFTMVDLEDLCVERTQWSQLCHRVAEKGGSAQHAHSGTPTPPHTSSLHAAWT